MLGSPVRLSKDRLRKDYLPSGISSYVRVLVNGYLAGNAFACRWTVDGKTICWITQLVVHRDYRERGLAAGLLNEIKMDGDYAYGVMSSHPAACLAASKAFGSECISSSPSPTLISVGSINTVSLDFIKNNAQSMMNASPVHYIRNAKLRGRLFNNEADNNLISSVDVEFYIDHKEPLEALAWIQESMHWSLGELLDGHEYILILQARRRFRSNSARQSITS